MFLKYFCFRFCAKTETGHEKEKERTHKEEEEEEKEDGGKDKKQTTEDEKEKCEDFESMNVHITDGSFCSDASYQGS